MLKLYLFRGCSRPLIIRVVIIDLSEEARQLAAMKAIAARGGSYTALPDLKDNPSELGQLFHKIADGVMSLLKSWVGDSRLDPSYEWLFRIGVYAVLVIFVAALACLIFMGVRSYLRKDKQWTGVAVAAPEPAAPASEIEALLARGAVKEAMRIRWKQYLRGRALEPSRTPHEIFGADDNVPVLDELMFGTREPTPEEFRAASASLTPERRA